MKINFNQHRSGLYLPEQKVPLSLEQLLAFRACAKVASGITANCNTKPIAGTETTIWIGNLEDLVKPMTMASGSNYIVENFTMTSPAVIYKFTGIKQSNVPSVKMNKGQFVNSWIHGLDFLVFANDGAAKKIVSDLANAAVFAIVENKWKGTGGSMAFEMYGTSVGLVMTAAERNPNDAATGGAWKLTFGPNDGEFEDNVPLTIFDTDYATSKSVITANE